MAVDVRVVEVKPQHAVAVRYKASMDKMGEMMGQAIGQVMAFVGRNKMRPAGMPFSAYPQMEPDGAGNWEVVSGMPVQGEAEASGEMIDYDLPGGKVAVVTHMGPYDTLAQTYEAMMGWIYEHGLAPAGAMWEYYFTDPSREPDRSKWRTDIYCPVK